MPDIEVGEYTYNPSKQIGKGRHATVYEGYHAGKGIKVAVKKVDWSSIHKSKHDNLRKKLQQTLGVQKKTYENVLAPLDFKEIQDEAYIIYELCDDTLDNYLGTTALSEEAALELFKQTAAIVYHKFATAHKFLLNREVSPENLLVVKSGDNVKLKFSDIAVGQFADDRALKWPNYYAPEVISQEEFIDKRKAEVFSLGLILYRFLVGRLPYSSLSELEEEKAKEDPFALPSDITEISDYTRNLLKRSLQILPDNRLPLPAVLKKFGFDLPEPGSLRFSTSQGELSPEMLLVKIEEATEEIVNLKERIRRLEAEKLEIELQVNLKMEQNEKDAHEQVEKLNEELQLVRQELSEALEQILRSDEQYDALDARKRKEIEELMQQLVQAHEALEEVARKTTEELVTYKRNIEELKDQLEIKQEEITHLKEEHEMVEMIKQEELASMKRELDELTELFVQIEQNRREDGDSASSRYDEMVRLKDQEIAELKKLLAQGNNTLKPNGISSVKPYSSFSSSLRPNSPSVELNSKPSWSNSRPTSPTTSNTPSKPSWSSGGSRPVSPSPSPTPSKSPLTSNSNSRPVSPNPTISRPASVSPEPSPVSPRTIIPPKAQTWTAQYAAANTSSTSLPRPQNSLQSKWTTSSKPTTTPSPTLSASVGSSPSSSTPKWTSPAAKTTSSPTSSNTPAKPAYMMVKTTPAATSSSAASSTASSASAAPAAPYTGQTYSATELRAMLKNPSSAFEGFDKALIEQYLDEGEFKQLLGMTKDDYNKLPKWKQAPLKSKAKLF